MHTAVYHNDKYERLDLLIMFRVKRINYAFHDNNNLIISCDSGFCTLSAQTKMFKKNETTILNKTTPVGFISTIHNGYIPDYTQQLKQYLCFERRYVYKFVWVDRQQSQLLLYVII